LPQLKPVVLDDIKETDSKATQNWKTIKAYFMSPSKILSLIHESVQMIDDGKILEETVEVAEGNLFKN